MDANGEGAVLLQGHLPLTHIVPEASKPLLQATLHVLRTQLTFWACGTEGHSLVLLHCAATATADAAAFSGLDPWAEPKQL
jgi:hypothetical protein